MDPGGRGHCPCVPRVLELVKNTTAAPAERAPEHDRERFHRVFCDHHATVSRWVRALGVPAEAVPDVTQDVFVVAYWRLPGFQPRVSLKGWLFGITRRVVKDYRRSAGRMQRRLEQLPAREGPREPEEELVRREGVQLLLRFLDDLDEGYRDVFVLTEIDGMTAPEIAETLDLKLATVYSRLRRVRLKFERALTRERARSRKDGRT